jgi:hypothetical protein
VRSSVLEDEVVVVVLVEDFVTSIKGGGMSPNRGLEPLVVAVVVVSSSDAGSTAVVGCADGCIFVTRVAVGPLVATGAAVGI